MGMWRNISMGRKAVKVLLGSSILISLHFSIWQIIIYKNILKLSTLLKFKEKKNAKIAWKLTIVTFCSFEISTMYLTWIQAGTLHFTSRGNFISYFLFKCTFFCLSLRFLVENSPGKNLFKSNNWDIVESQ